MQREYCPKCAYPASTCLCSHIVTLAAATELHILQHPLEAKVAKNTARLIKLCLPSTHIWQGEKPCDFAQLQDQLNMQASPTAILYPSSSAAVLGKPNKSFCSGSTTPKFKRLILIDATWRKAHKIWMLNPWLHTLPAVKFENIDSEYHVRHSRIKGALSTLESAYHYLALTEPERDFSPLMSIFLARQAMLRQPHQDRGR